MRTMGFRLAFIAVVLLVVGGAGPVAVAAIGAGAVSPTQALTLLMRGNQRFQKDQTIHPLLRPKRREDLVGGQAPFAVILSCSDSRVPPELVFDQGEGGVFVVRIAGNTVTKAGLESIGYAVDHLGTNLIMVLGHDKCGAVKGAIDACSGQADTTRPEIFSNICPAVEQARKKAGDSLESSAIDLNVTEQVKLLKESPQFQKRVADGSLKIVGARYNLQSGKVVLLDGK